jgi:hypothetical protein
MKILVFLVCGMFIASFLFFFGTRVIAQSVSVSASVPSTCGNGVVDAGEQCDGSNLNGQTCASQGFSGGTLSCTASCAFDTAQCTSRTRVSPAVVSGGGDRGGDGGGGEVPPSPSLSPSQASVTLSGSAYPLSTITVLQDAQIADQSIAGPDGNFTVTVNDLAAGSYIFSVYSEDGSGNRSSLFTFPTSLSVGASTQVGSIFISPTIAMDKQEVKQGDPLVIFGETAPDAQVTITLHSSQAIYVQTTSTKAGAYVYDLNTAQLDLGSHAAIAQATVANLMSNDSVSRSFTVGSTDVATQSTSTPPLKGDFEGNGRVDLVDFSMLAYWYGKSAPPVEYRLDGAQAIDLTDFSIMAYYWTG